MMVAITAQIILPDQDTTRICTEGKLMMWSVRGMELIYTSFLEDRVVVEGRKTHFSSMISSRLATFRGAPRRSSTCPNRTQVSHIISIVH